MRCHRLVATIGGLISTAIAALATSYHVSNGGNDFTGDGSLLLPFATIQKGIDMSAMAGDEVLVLDGVYTGFGNVAVNFAGKAVAVRSYSGNPLTCIVDGGGVTVGFQFVSGEPAGAVLEGLTIQNCVMQAPGDGEGQGGAVKIVGASPTIRNCIFSNNASIGGEAFFGFFPVNGLGGAIYAFGSFSLIEDCVFQNNIAQGGNGFDSLSTGIGGGGAVYSQSSSLFLKRCTFIGNQSVSGLLGASPVDAVGGACYFEGQSTILESCLFEQNASMRGGGLFSLNNVTDLVNCVFSLNSASVGNGGGAAFLGAPFSMATCTIAGNDAAGSGGGAAFDSGADGTITNSIFYGNTALVGDPQIYVNLFGMPAVTAAFSIVQGSGGSGGWVQSGVGDSGSNLDANPAFVRNPLTGGPADAGDLRLTGASPAVDSGSNALLPGGTVADIDGNARVFNGTVDRGAYELSLTITDRILILKGQVQNLIDTNQLGAALGQVLKTELDAAISNLNQVPSRPARAILRMLAFNAAVTVYQFFGILDAATANSFRSQSNLIISLIQAS